MHDTAHREKGSWRVSDRLADTGIGGVRKVTSGTDDVNRTTTCFGSSETTQTCRCMGPAGQLRVALRIWRGRQRSAIFVSAGLDDGRIIECYLPPLG